MYSVSFWVSHPDNDNDDCNIGYDFDNKEAALNTYLNSIQNNYTNCCAFIEIDGPDLNMVRKNQYYKPTKNNNTWRREIAREAGMLGGVEAYNEVMGY